MKTFKVDDYVLVTDRTYDQISDEDLAYMQVPQLKDYMNYGFSYEEAVEILYASATMGAQMMGIAEFSVMPEIAKQMWYGWMMGAYLASNSNK